MKTAIFAALLFIGCAQWGPRPDEEVLAQRDYIVVPDLSKLEESDPRNLYDVRIENDSLKMKARYGGGCREHAFTLYLARASRWNNTLWVYVRHDGNKDMCRAWIDAHPLAFDLRHLKSDLGLKGDVRLSSHSREMEPFSVDYK